MYHRQQDLHQATHAFAMAAGILRKALGLLTPCNIDARTEASISGGAEALPQDLLRYCPRGPVEKLVRLTTPIGWRAVSRVRQLECTNRLTFHRTAEAVERGRAGAHRAV